jgi:TPR repeat protein
MPVLCRTLGIGCPISADAYAALTGAAGVDREAQFRIARLLQRGDGIARDEQAATGWFGKAAEQGHVAAALELNRLRREGAAVPADEAKIAASLSLAVEKGDLDAMRALAEIKIEGRGVPRNPEQGLGLLRHAIASGSALAAQDLANLYLRGAPAFRRTRPKASARWQYRRVWAMPRQCWSSVLSISTIPSRRWSTPPRAIAG